MYLSSPVKNNFKYNRILNNMGRRKGKRKRGGKQGFLKDVFDIKRREMEMGKRKGDLI